MMCNLLVSIILCRFHVYRKKIKKKKDKVLLHYMQSMGFKYMFIAVGTFSQVKHILDMILTRANEKKKKSILYFK